MPDVLAASPPVELFLHDSLHTYDHMSQEFEIAIEHMDRGGVLASEDIDANTAWDDILDDQSDRIRCAERFYAKHGLDETHKEVGLAGVIPK
jgi:hypothetical protein